MSFEFPESSQSISAPKQDLISLADAGEDNQPEEITLSAEEVVVRNSEERPIQPVQDKIKDPGSEAASQLEIFEAAWLSSFPGAAEWLSSSAGRSEAEELLQQGSFHLNASRDSEDTMVKVRAARRVFLQRLGVGAHAIAYMRLNEQDFPPTDTVISIISLLTARGIDPKRVIDRSPTILHSDAAIEKKLDALDSLNLDTKKLINSDPGLLFGGIETVKRRMDYFLGLGFDPIKIINTHPPVLHYSDESIEETVNFLKESNLNYVYIISMLPSTLGYALDSLKIKIENYRSLGLDPVKIVNALPSALSYSTELVREKVDFVREAATLLGWEGSVDELFEGYPGLLGFNIGKLKILRRLAAQIGDNEDRKMLASDIRSRLMVPLEKCILILDQAGDDLPSLRELFRAGKQLKLSAMERKDKALIANQGLAQRTETRQIARQYDRYRGKNVNES
jgi:hypothetical protein